MPRLFARSMKYHFGEFRAARISRAFEDRMGPWLTKKMPSGSIRVLSLQPARERSLKRGEKGSSSNRLIISTGCPPEAVYLNTIKNHTEW
jgi:hypothetical protein